MNLLFAPVQGHTDAPYRHFHNEAYPASGNPSYYTPFIRLEHGAMRNKDVKDYSSSLNDGLRIIPQLIFRDRDELISLVSLIRQEGATEIDLNMGCPFPLQTGHGRGAATIANPELADAVAETVRENPDISFSVKMRLGMSDPTEWETLIPRLNDVTLRHIAVHPRVARQQYGGELDFLQFSRILDQSTNPVVFNGELKTPSDISTIIERFPGIAGVMAGRGILARPSLFEEFVSGNEWSRERRIETMMGFHRRLLDYYSSTLCGDTQIISKIKPFWEYAEEEIGRKPWKAIKKASNIAKYHSAVAMI